MLRTKFCDLVGIEVPVVQAGMSIYTSAELAAAVSNAGGLGSLGVWQRSMDLLLDAYRIWWKIRSHRVPVKKFVTTLAMPVRVAPSPSPS